MAQLAPTAITAATTLPDATPVASPSASATPPTACPPPWGVCTASSATGNFDGKWRNIKVKLVPPKGLPPLRPGQAYTFAYVYQRSVDAGTGTTYLQLRLTVHQPVPPGKQDCNAANDAYTVTF